jgi:DNA-binding GntR family transcriptional regulator
MLLEKEALVDIQPRRRPRVKTFDKATIREIYRTRACLLELVAATVAEIASLEQLQRLSAVVDKMEKANRAGDVGGYLWANIEFHDLNLTLSGNSTAKRIIESLLLRTIPLRRKSLSSPGRMAVSLDDHRRLLKAYQDRDANLAAALIRSNHMAALQNIERLMTIGVVPSG